MKASRAHSTKKRSDAMSPQSAGGGNMNAGRSPNGSSGRQRRRFARSIFREVKCERSPALGITRHGGATCKERPRAPVGARRAGVRPASANGCGGAACECSCRRRAPQTRRRALSGCGICASSGQNSAVAMYSLSGSHATPCT